MPALFNSILTGAGLKPADVRLLRHKDGRSARGWSPYELWRDKRDDPMDFNLYQATQRIENRSRLNAPFWASFVGTPADETLFVGLYTVCYRGVLNEDMPRPHVPGEFDKAGTCDFWHIARDDRLSDLIGRLLVDWGDGTRAWIQYADRRNKPVLEIRREFREDDFPGFLKFQEKLSRLDALPAGWKSALKASGGVYLLVCPGTREQYVGAAYGADGFWGRWQEYVSTGHGGNIALKSRELSDYFVSILEVAGTSASFDELIAMESNWKNKLKSREMGLNRN